MPILFLSRLSHFLRNFPLFLPTADSSLHGSGHLLFISCCKKDRSFASVQNGGSHSITSHPPSFTPYSYQEGVGFWDEVAEWLRRWTANPLCSARVGSNPILVERRFLFFRHWFEPMTVNFLAEWKQLLIHCKYDLLADFETSGFTL